MSVSKATVLDAFGWFKDLIIAEVQESIDAIEPYSLPTASRWQKGGVMIAPDSGLEMSGDYLLVTITGGQSNAIENISIDGQIQPIDANKTVQLNLSDYAKKSDIAGSISALSLGDKNIIEAISIDDTTQTIKDKTAKLDLSAYLKKTDIASGVRMKGSVNSFADLPATAEVGDLYNIKNAGGVDGDGTPIEAGDNVVFTDKGTWDVMAGFIDLSDFAKKSDLAGAMSSINSLSLAISNFHNYDLPTASATVKGGVKIGDGLEMQGETLNVALKAETYDEFTGATSITGGQSGLVPQPKAGDNKKFLCGDGTWANASELVTVVIGSGGSATAMSSGVSTIQGGLWQDLIDGVPVLKLRYGDYEYNFNHDTTNRVGDGSTPLDTTTKGVEYVLTTVPSSQDGELWYVVKDGVPNLAMHKWAYDYFFNYDTITYKGSYANLFSYLPFDSTTADALGHLWTLGGTPTIEISPAGVKALKSTGSLTSPATVTDAFKAIQGMDWTLDFWLTIENVASYKSNTNAYNLLTVSCTAKQLVGSEKFPNNRFFIQEGKLYRTDGGNGIKKEACGDNILVGQRTHFALSGNGNLFINGKLVGTDFNTVVHVDSSNGGKTRLTMNAITKFVLFGSYSTSYPMYIDHFRIFKNQIVWTGDFTPPTAEDYLQ